MSTASPLSASLLSALKAIFPGDSLLVGPEETLVFGADASRLQARPLAVVRPTDTEQVSKLLALAQAEAVPVYSRGRGTNVVGGCVPDPPGVVISTARLNKILEISPEDFLVRAQPGVVTRDLQEACAAKGLFYPPDPASAKFCSIGGNLAMCAGGMRAVKYGATRDYVLGLTVVLPGGRVLKLGSACHKNVAGLDLVRLFVGSEGTLGFIAEATLKLLPLPEAQASLLASFAGQDQCLEAVKGVFAAGLLPTALEFMPEEVLAALANLGPTPWPDKAKSALLFKLDGSRDGVLAELGRLRRLLEGFEPLCLEEAHTPDQGRALWEIRRQINQASFTVAPDKLSDDIAVPRGRVGETIRRIRDLAQELGVKILAFGHLGDGNLHVNVMYDAKNPQETAKAQEAKRRVLKLALSLGGVISGEHGLGRTKLAWLPDQVGPEAVALMRQVKAVFDPKGIMNPGKAY
jgi:D-lactate dehydrogenase (cytochrome)/glycolate oxidase